MRVYAVTEGEYSDYHVDAVFLTEKMARRWVKVRFSDDGYASPRVEAWDVLAALPTQRVNWVIRQNVDVPGGPAGEPHEAELTEWSHTPPLYQANLRLRPLVRVEARQGGVTLRVLAPTREQAWKVFRDRLARWAAREVGGHG